MADTVRTWGTTHKPAPPLGGPAMAANPLRLARLGRPLLMVPLDHGVSMGAAPGLDDPATVMRTVVDAGATCLTMHKGLVPRAAAVAGDAAVLMHLSASTDVGPDPDDKRLVASVEEAVAAGCDGVSIHVNLGAPTEARMLEDAGRVATACTRWGMPLVAMVYPRGPGIDPFAPDLVTHAARLGAELGADVVKVPYTGDADSFRRVVQGATVPVIVAGGPRRAGADGFQAFLDDVRGARHAGAAGISIGRNVFQADDPAAAMRALHEVFG